VVEIQYAKAKLITSTPDDERISKTLYTKPTLPQLIAKDYFTA
jgi:hypothetical protein